MINVNENQVLLDAVNVALEQIDNDDNVSVNEAIIKVLEDKRDELKRPVDEDAVAEALQEADYARQLLNDKVELSWKERIVDTPDSEYKTQTEYYGPGKIGFQEFSWTFLMGDCIMDIQTVGKADLTKRQSGLVLEAFEDAVLGDDTYDPSADRAFFNDDYEVKDGVGYYKGHGTLNGNKFLFTMSEDDGAISLGKDYGKDERNNIHQLIWDAAI